MPPEDHPRYKSLLAREKLEINRRNLNLLIRQVETDKARIERGQINLTDLSQSEASLAGAKAKLIAAENDFLSSRANYEKIVGKKPTENIQEIKKVPTHTGRNFRFFLFIFY